MGPRKRQSDLSSLPVRKFGTVQSGKKAVVAEPPKAPPAARQAAQREAVLRIFDHNQLFGPAKGLTRRERREKRRAHRPSGRRTCPRPPRPP